MLLKKFHTIFAIMWLIAFHATTFKFLLNYNYLIDQDYTSTKLQFYFGYQYIVLNHGVKTLRG